MGEAKKSIQSSPQIDNVLESHELIKERIPRLNERLTEELIFAFVGPVGSGCSKSAKLLTATLQNDYGYTVHYYRLSDFIKESAHLIEKNLPDSLSNAERISNLQDIGDGLRKACGGNYLAAKAVEKIAEQRDEIGFGDSNSGKKIPKKLRHVHIIDSLKNPEEIELLKATYGQIFWLIGVFAPYTVRTKRLLHDEDIDEDKISSIVEKDYREDNKSGQNVRDVFYQADYFLRNDKDNVKHLESSLKRFIEILFCIPVHTPTTDESSMYAAYAEAAKSACLSRQVGAAIVSHNGELIGLGRNDVPAYKGGLYNENHGDNDHRCHAWRQQQCYNDAKKEKLYQQIYSQLHNNNLLSERAELSDIIKALKSTDVRSLIEFSRAVHAEMDAITSVARTHKAGLLGGTLYSTTYPCHSCARHIVASGITKVFYIEPYPKSMAIELHSDTTSEDEVDEGKKVLFLQYTGVAPKNILKLFNMGANRKEKSGKLIKFDKKTASPVVAVSLDDYSTHEKMVIAELVDNEKQATDRQTSFI